MHACIVLGVFPVEQCTLSVGNPVLDELFGIEESHGADAEDGTT